MPLHHLTHHSIHHHIRIVASLIQPASPLFLDLFQSQVHPRLQLHHHLQMYHSRLYLAQQVSQATVQSRPAIILVEMGTLMVSVTAL